MFGITKKKLKNQTEATGLRVVKTTRWIHSSELQIGMYVRELDCPWEDTNFMFQGFIIESVKMMHELQEVSEQVCVESEKLVRAPSRREQRFSVVG